MLARPERDADGRLVIYLDIATQIGINTGFLFFDGRAGNITIGNQDAVLDGPIINRVVGTGDEAGESVRLRTVPFINEDSRQIYRTRSQLVQFRDVREQATLDKYSQIYLSYRAFPKFTFLMNVLDLGDAFLNSRLGNIAMAHVSEAVLPGGVQGWRGPVRIVAMAYTEDQNLLTAKVEAL
jgi:hypothetical protein